LGGAGRGFAGVVVALGAVAGGSLLGILPII